MPNVVRIAEWLNQAFDRRHIAKFDLEALAEQSQGRCILDTIWRCV